MNVNLIVWKRFSVGTTTRFSKSDFCCVRPIRLRYQVVVVRNPEVVVRFIIG